VQLCPQGLWLGADIRAGQTIGPHFAIGGAHYVAERIATVSALGQPVAFKPAFSRRQPLLTHPAPEAFVA